MKFVAPLVLTLAALAACAPTTPTRPLGEPILQRPSDSVRAAEDRRAALAGCQADELQRLVGMTQDDLLRVQILGAVRVIRPGSAVTMDFIPTRLNIEIGQSGTVRRVYCG